MYDYDVKSFYQEYVFVPGSAWRPGKTWTEQLSLPWAGATAEGMVTVTDRPPSLRGQAVAVPPWIAAMDATMARPSPERSWDVRSLSRWNGWKMRPASVGLTTGPVLATISCLLPTVAVRVLIQMSPAGMLYRTRRGRPS
jgi:hypothetical protein